MRIPRYKDLPVRPDLPPRSAWGLWGDDDQLGTLNLLTEERAVRAAGLVRRGQTYPLGLPLDQPGPALFGRSDAEHHVYSMRADVWDDSIDNLYPQASTQWDALRHVSHPEFGFWNGLGDSDAVSGTPNGIEHYARKGIVGRGVLLDVARWRESQGRPIDPTSAEEITPEDLEGSRRDQGVELEGGDIVLIRTGWVGWYLQQPDETRGELARDASRSLRSPGLIGGETMAEWLWDARIAAVAADNPGLEACPHVFEIDQYLHFRLLPLLGMAVGEMWNLDALATACAEDDVYDFMVAAAPLDIPNGVGSPANAVAIR